VSSVGEGAACVPEQLVLDERVRDGRTIDRDERVRGAPAHRMDRVSSELLAGAGLAFDQHRRIMCGDGAQPIEGAQKSWCAAKQCPCVSAIRFAVRGVYASDRHRTVVKLKARGKNAKL